MEIKTALVAQKELNVLRGISYEPAVNGFELSLTKTLPDASGAATEATYTNYEPALLPFTTWFPAEEGKIRNSSLIEFTDCLSLEGSGLIQGWQIREATGGPVWYAGHLRQGMSIEYQYNFFFDTIDKNFVLNLNNSTLPDCCGVDLLNRRANVLRGSSLTPQATITVELMKRVVTGQTVTYVPLDSAGYAPAEYALTAGAWLNPGLTRTTENLLPIVFDQFEADTGEIRGYRLISEGEMWYQGLLAPGKFGWNRDKLTILPGGIVIKA